MVVIICAVAVCSLCVAAYETSVACLELHVD